MSGEAVKMARELFNIQIAPQLAASIGFNKTVEADGRTTRFSYFEDDERFAIVAGEQEERDVDRALAVGIKYSGSRRLVLVLPSGWEFPTLQRAAWLQDVAQPRVYVHSDQITIDECDLPTRDATIGVLVDKLNGVSPAVDLANSMKPAHLATLGDGVADLVEWATKHPLLDHGHRRSERSWHCIGQRVLSIRSTKTGLSIRAGIHTTIPTPETEPIAVSAASPLTSSDGALIRQRVASAIDARTTEGGEYHKPDEHWLQAVIRRDPSCVGIEQPALREVPAWRPVATGWNRGFVDLVGLDGQGDIRIVETKLAKNPDDLLVFQGLDYYRWACAYQTALRDRLGGSPHARLVVHYVVGATQPDDHIHCSQHLDAQLGALHPDYPWRFQEVRGWYQPPASPMQVGPESILLPVGQTPEVRS